MCWAVAGFILLSGRWSCCLTASKTSRTLEKYLMERTAIGYHDDMCSYHSSIHPETLSSYFMSIEVTCSLFFFPHCLLWVSSDLCWNHSSKVNVHKKKKMHSILINKSGCCDYTCWWLCLHNKTSSISNLMSQGGWSLSQLSLGERQGTPWTGRQSITGTQRQTTMHAHTKGQCRVTN